MIQVTLQVGGLGYRLEVDRSREESKRIRWIGFISDLDYQEIDPRMISEDIRNQMLALAGETP